ncbi:hypothetical protein [Nostoc punctiforme]|uniref:hypothetical protein n=1 Tax=Nostoc punctiforme TaxID=272131 RepID=UPI0003104B18|nr:hypothetical protein [Nostoc punctiforme]
MARYNGDNSVGFEDFFSWKERSLCLSLQLLVHPFFDELGKIIVNVLHKDI